jgi:hypothetical protein
MEGGGNLIKQGGTIHYREGITVKRGYTTGVNQKRDFYMFVFFQSFVHEI